MQQEESKLSQLQRAFFGERFVGASISKIGLSEGAASAASRWVNNPSRFLVITGPPGVGKTYFCSGLLEYALAKGCTFRAWSERRLFEKLREGIASGGGSDYLGNLHQFADDHLVIIDDIGSSGHTTWREEILMELVDFRYASNKITVFTSNLSRNEFYTTYNPRIASRLFSAENTILDLTGLQDQRALGN